MKKYKLFKGGSDSPVRNMDDLAGVERGQVKSERYAVKGKSYRRAPNRSSGHEEEENIGRIWNSA